MKTTGALMVGLILISAFLGVVQIVHPITISNTVNAITVGTLTADSIMYNGTDLRTVIMQQIANYTPPPPPPPPDAPPILNGFAGSASNTAQVQQVIDAITKYGGNAWRYSANPSWITGGTRPWSTTYIDYFLANCNYYIIVDRNHLYPPSTMTDGQWTQAESDIFNQILATYGDNPRVIIEIVNECNQTVAAGYQTKIQTIITDIRTAGYTNYILQDNQFQTGAGNWVKYTDAKGTYQGQHEYMNQFSGNLNTMKNHFIGSGQAVAQGITKFCNTEVGANTGEKNAFTTSNVSLLNQWLSWSRDQGIGNMVWLNHGTENLATYESLGFTFPMP